MLSISARNFLSSSRPSLVSSKSLIIVATSTPSSPTRVIFSSMALVAASISFFFGCHQGLVIGDRLCLGRLGILQICLHLIFHLLKNPNDLAALRHVLAAAALREERREQLAVH